LQAVNNIVADSFAADMGKTRDEALALMSEDYYMTGWEQLVENNIISDVINPKDVTFPEPTQEEFSFDFFFMQAEENIVKEKMYQAEERYLEDWEKNISEMGKIAAILKPESKPEETPVEDKITTEETMNLQEFLEVTPEAKAEYDAALLSAEEKGRAESSNVRAKIAKILTLEGVTISPEAKAAIDGEMAIEDYKDAVILAQKNLRVENKDESPFAGLVAKQTPKEQDPTGGKEVEAKFDKDAVRAQAKSFLDEIGGI